MKKFLPALFLLVSLACFSQNTLKQLVGNWSGKGKVFGENITLTLSTVSMSDNFQDIELKIDDAGSPSKLSINALFSFDAESKEYAVNWFEKIMGGSSDALGKVEFADETINLRFNEKGKNFFCKFTFNPQDDTWNFSLEQFSDNKWNVVAEGLLKKK